MAEPAVLTERMNLKLKAKGLTAEEIKTIRKTIRLMNRKRKFDNVSCFRYKFKLQNETTKKIAAIKGKA